MEELDNTAVAGEKCSSSPLRGGNEESLSYPMPVFSQLALVLGKQLCRGPAY